MEFSPMSVIDRIGPRPICIVTAARYDVTHPLEYIHEADKRAREPKEFVLLPLEARRLQKAGPHEGAAGSGQLVRLAPQTGVERPAGPRHRWNLAECWRWSLR